MNLNIAGFFNAFKAFTRPSLFLPHHTVATFNELPIPLDSALQSCDRKVDIKAVVLDKDDCFAYPNSTEVYAPYRDKFAALRAAYPGRRLLIVSNTAGAASWDRDDGLARKLEQVTGGVHVLRHAARKPACGDDIMAYFAAHPETGVRSPAQVAVVGDRLATDVVLANQMGAWAVWIRDGVTPHGEKSVFSRMERQLVPFLVERGFHPIEPGSGPFE